MVTLREPFWIVFLAALASPPWRLWKNPEISGLMPPRTTSVKLGSLGRLAVEPEGESLPSDEFQRLDNLVPLGRVGHLALHRQVEPLGGEVFQERPQGRLVERLVSGRRFPLLGVGIEAVELDVEEQVVSGNPGSQAPSVLSGDDAGQEQDPGQSSPEAPQEAVPSVVRRLTHNEILSMRFRNDHPDRRVTRLDPARQEMVRRGRGMVNDLLRTEPDRRRLWRWG